MPEFPELKDIVVRPEPVDHTLWIVGGSVVLVALIALVLWVVRAARRRASGGAAPAFVEARAAALSDLRLLKEKSPELPDEELVTEVQRVLRAYLHRRYGALGHYRTADELIGRRRDDAPPPNPVLTHIEDVLRRCETLRYREGEPADEIARLGLIDQAIESLVNPIEAADAWSGQNQS